jgi:hypothetical protein
MVPRVPSAPFDANWHLLHLHRLPAPISIAMGRQFGTGGVLPMKLLTMPRLKRMDMHLIIEALEKGESMREIEIRFRMGPVAILTEVVREMVRREARRERRRGIAA